MIKAIREKLKSQHVYYVTYTFTFTKPSAHNDFKYNSPVSSTGWTILTFPKPIRNSDDLQALGDFIIEHNDYNDLDNFEGPIILNFIRLKKREPLLIVSQVLSALSILLWAIMSVVIFKS